MNVYDFDNTILRGDSTALFVLFCLRRHPGLLAMAPGQLKSGLAFRLGWKDKQSFKEGLFAALMPRLADPEGEISAFWDENIGRVKAFYGRLHRPDDVVVSASPEFLILPACRRLGIGHALASPVDARTGLYRGGNCHGEEKVRRFREAFPEGRIESFYSDSHSDDPLAALAERAFLVKGERLLPWGRGK